MSNYIFKGIKGIIGKCLPADCLDGRATLKGADDKGSIRFVPRNREHLRVKSVGLNSYIPDLASWFKKTLGISSPNSSSQFFQFNIHSDKIYFS